MGNTIYLSSAYLAPVAYYAELLACENAPIVNTRVLIIKMILFINTNFGCKITIFF